MQPAITADQIASVDASGNIQIQPPTYTITIDQLTANVATDQAAVDAAQAIVDDRTASLASLQDDLATKQATLAADQALLSAARPQMDAAVAQLKVATPLQTETAAPTTAQ